MTIASRVRACGHYCGRGIAVGSWLSLWAWFGQILSNHIFDSMIYQIKLDPPAYIRYSQQASMLRNLQQVVEDKWIPELTGATVGGLLLSCFMLWLLNVDVTVRRSHVLSSRTPTG